MANRGYFLTALAVGVLGFATVCAASPAVFGLPPGRMESVKALVESHSPSIALSFGAFIEHANRALVWATPSILDKPRVAASGDKRDYFSLGPYWWPDPAKPGGLPYVKRDGHINPDSRRGTDSVPFANLCAAVETLGQAYYLTGKEAYADKAAELVRVWFLAPDTSMYPRVNYGQAVPGVTNGRLEGIIEMRHLIKVADGVTLLRGTPAWTAKEDDALKEWFASYLEWLRTNRLPVDQTSTENNHVTWRAVQIVHLNLILGHREEARRFLAAEFPRLIDMQIEISGAQVHELVRANSLGYCLFNLEALLRLATLGEHLGIDCWSLGRANHNLKAAVDALAPYADPRLAWPKPEVRLTDRSRLLPLLAQAHHATRDSRYEALLVSFLGEGTDTWRLYWLPLESSPAMLPGRNASSVVSPQP